MGEWQKRDDARVAHGHIGVNCPYKWTNSKDEEDNQGSAWESELEGEKPEELASLEELMMRKMVLAQTKQNHQVV